MTDSHPLTDAPPAPKSGHDSRPPTVADPDRLVEVASGVWVLPDHARIAHVPNIGIVLGTHSALVIDAGLGTANGHRVLEAARGLAGERRLFFTATHFHPEHLLGARAFVGEAVIIGNGKQAAEVQEKGQWFLDTFSDQTPVLAAALDGAEYVTADITYDGPSCRLDLGDRTVVLLHRGFGHTRSDQVVFVPVARVLFTGDLLEQGFFWIMPDVDAAAEIWVTHLREMESLDPSVVVPGHGQIGDRGLIAVVAASLTRLRERIVELHANGLSLDAIIGIVEPELLEAYPDWDSREFVQRAIRNTHRRLIEHLENTAEI